MKVDLGRLAQIRAWDGGDGEIADQQAVEDAIALLLRARVITEDQQKAKAMTDETRHSTETVSHDDDGECPVCGGEGFTFDCFDGCCSDAEIGCDDCYRRCECQRKPLTAYQTERG